MKGDRRSVSASIDGTCQRMIATCFEKVRRKLEAEMEHQEAGGDWEDATHCALLLFEGYIYEQRGRLPRQDGRTSKKRELVAKLIRDLEAAKDNHERKELEAKYIKEARVTSEGMRKAIQRYKAKDGRWDRLSKAAREYNCR